MQIDISQCPPSIRDHYVSSEPFSPPTGSVSSPWLQQWYLLVHVHAVHSIIFQTSKHHHVMFAIKNTLLRERLGVRVVVGVRKEQIICHPPKRNKRTKIFKRLLGSHSAFMAPTFARSSGSRVHIAPSLFLAKLKTRIIRPGMHYVMTCYIDAPASTLFSAGIKGREPS